MLSLKKLIQRFSFVVLVISLPSLAETGAANSSRFETYVSSAGLGVSNSSFQIDVSPGFQFAPIGTVPWLQMGTEVTFQRLDFRAGSTRNVVLMVGMTANMGPTQNDAFFVSIGDAFRRGTTDAPDNTSVDPNGNGFYFITGKRFPISGGLSLRPSLGVVSCGTTGMVFRPLALSYLF